ncbi:MAG: hypothetical protein HXY50_09380 [Ignavibacteriaceae bacterium]|nr:hypothetical protein [Ignavibacteriaceae bacterium]
MRNLLSIFVLAAVFIFVSCEKEKEEVQNNNEQLPAGFHKVKVIEAIDASNYSIINVEENDKQFWIAVTKMDVKEGDVLYFSKSMEMKNFKSESLNRTFESILFVDDAKKDLTGGNTMQMHPVPTTTREEQVAVQKVKGGKTIAEIFGAMTQLSGKTVKVRGKVMKFNQGIMGTNWIHIQDGTTYQNDFDLLVTSDTPVQVGQIIVAEGKLSTNKDFGAGYAYKALIEGAKIKVE